MFAQIGTSAYQPKHYAYRDFITPEEFIEKIREADIVVSHGASGSIMKALNAGKKVIAVTRLEKYNEHIKRSSDSEQRGVQRQRLCADGGSGTH
jgi:UDP-N-acetylglucosamine transferase subunit ALG13